MEAQAGLHTQMYLIKNPYFPILYDPDHKIGIARYEKRRFDICAVDANRTGAPFWAGTS